MQKILKSGIVFVFIAAAVVICFGIQPNLVKQTDFKTTEIRKNSARDLYLKNCARCHGADGKSVTELGEKYDATDLTGKYVQKMSGKKMTRVISNGKEEMPAFKKRLNSEEIAALVNYVRSLK